ncbi:hypothetical protein LTR56_015665 [Elasticomyces elasticus]|nr:hypothetical protein LTR22_022233 [Elasticomyces elasticus]KAK3633751.1 hypothetical protein LTR56_015665 [Elasticomyces elasticus]KAK4914550.1 hypothetical protein LTR49_017243 [Elasticomyces elasticus]KAK5754375.1 hypothetical protein LTS12_015553 [Elasticomyces elasticus]
MTGGKRRRDDAFKPSKKHQANTSSARPTTRLTTKHSVFNAVLLTTELLERILSHLPMKDLLLAQRVSPKWRDVICQSPLLQQQLFLPRREEFVWNLTLADAETGSGLTLTRLSADIYHQTPDNCPNAIHAGDINEMTVQLIDLYNLFESATASHKSPPPDILEVNCKLLAFSCPTASWRKMLITQPPTHKISTHFEFEDLKVIEKDLVCSSGVTMGDIVKPIEEAAATGDELDGISSEITMDGFVVMNTEDQSMEVIDEDEWTEKYFPDPVHMYDM